MSGIHKLILLLFFILSGLVGIVYVIVKMHKPREKKYDKKPIMSLTLILSGFVSLVILGIIKGGAVLLIVLGSYVIYCAFMDYDWFMNYYKAASLKSLFGRDGMRVFYIILGIIIFLTGLFSFSFSIFSHIFAI